MHVCEQLPSLYVARQQASPSLTPLLSPDTRISSLLAVLFQYRQSLLHLKVSVGKITTPTLIVNSDQHAPSELQSSHTSERRFRFCTHHTKVRHVSLDGRETGLMRVRNLIGDLRIRHSRVPPVLMRHR
jgi:hypothetical protein